VLVLVLVVVVVLVLVVVSVVLQCQHSCLPSPRVVLTGNMAMGSMMSEVLVPVPV
jgi:hypothetical protein